jgi:uncharacterized glyoxalase superfamily protein PhnB
VNPSSHGATKPRLDAIGIITADMTRSFEFYRLLGFDIPEGLELEPHAEITLPGGLRFMWDTVELMQSMEPEYTHAPEHGIGAFLCASASEVDATYNRLLEAGFQGVKAPWDAFWGQRYAIARDPDGHKVDLFASLGAS